MLFQSTAVFLCISGTFLAAFGSFAHITCNLPRLSAWMVAGGLYLLVILISTMVYKARHPKLTMNFLTICGLLLFIWL